MKPHYDRAPVERTVRLGGYMAIDFSKHKKGDTINIHCCNDCIQRHGLTPKFPPDSGSSSWMCEVCGHLNIGSSMDCVIGDWLSLRILPNAEAKRERSESA